MLASIGSAEEVYAVAKRYGIAPEELRRLADEEATDAHYIDARRRLWDFLRDKIGLSPENRRVAEGDYDQAGFAWDDIVTHLLTSNDVYTEAFPFRDSGNADETVTEGNAAEWLWDFYRAGRPKQPSRREMLERTLRRLLDRRREIKEEEANIPF